MIVFLVSERLPVAPIIEGPVNQTVVRGEDATFECKVLMSDSQPLLQWLKHIERNGSFVNEKGEPYVEILQVLSYLFLQRSPFIMLCLRSIGMDIVVSEPHYKETILQQKL